MSKRGRFLAGIIGSIIIGGVVLPTSVLAWSAASTVAVITRVVEDVTKRTGLQDWAKAQSGDPLVAGDFVRTGDRSLAIVKFVDNSILRLREKSEAQLRGELKDGAFSKSVHLGRGVIGFDVQRREDEQFTFTSPTSVASIRGTQGLLAVEERGDELVVTEGLVHFLNTISERSVNVAAGQTGISLRDGSIDVRPSTVQERERAFGALGLEGDGGQNELKLELQDPEGNKKELKIRYRD